MSGRERLGLRIVAEGALIVLSVVLALAVDSLREQRALDAVRDDALRRIRVELTANLDAVRSALPYHDSVLSTTATLLAEPGELAGVPALAIAQRAAPRGIRPPELSRTAWDAAIASDAVALLDLETAALVASVYGQQRNGVETTVLRLTDRIFTTESFDEELGVRQMRLLDAMLGEIRAQEASLADAYARVLAELADTTETGR